MDQTDRRARIEVLGARIRSFNSMHGVRDAGCLFFGQLHLELLKKVSEIVVTKSLIEINRASSHDSMR